MLRVIVLLAITGVTSWLVHDAARACSPYSDLGAPQTLPTNGAVDVPLDAIVQWVFPATNLDRLQPPVTQAEIGEVAVRTASGAPVAGEITIAGTAAHVSVVFRPHAPLTPDTVYEVLDRVVENTSWGASIGEPHLRLTFTTGTRAFTTPPSELPDRLAVDYTCCSNMCCFSTSFALAWAPEPERLFQVTRLGGRAVLAFENAAHGVIEGGWYENPDLYGDGTFEVRSVNVAGLLSPPASIFVEDPCTPPEVEADTVEPMPDTAEPTPERAIEEAPPPAIRAAAAPARATHSRRCLLLLH